VLVYAELQMKNSYTAYIDFEIISIAFARICEDFNKCDPCWLAFHRGAMKLAFQFGIATGQLLSTGEAVKEPGVLTEIKTTSQQ
jgi:hypothetical protein